jgi:hypothetical protein
LGQACGTTYDCNDRYIGCGSGVCGGGGLPCTTYGEFYPTGLSYDCASRKSGFHIFLRDSLIRVDLQYTVETIYVQTFRAANWVAHAPLIWIAPATTRELPLIAGLMAGVVGPALDAKRMMVRQKAHRSIVLARMVCSRFSGQYHGMTLTRHLFVIGYCKAGFCAARVDASPTPNAKRQLAQPGQVRQQLCAAGMVACPVQGKGYEVR